MRLLGFALGFVGLVAAGVPVETYAQGGPPAMKLKSGKPYTHPHTKIVVPEILGGMKRSGGQAYFGDDLNLGIQYESNNASEAITVYVYRNTAGNIPIWFDRAREVIEKRSNFGNVKPFTTPVSFTAPGQDADSAMGITYALLQSSYKSSALALIPAGEFYVKIRASSSVKTPQETQMWMDQIIKQIQWPKQAVVQPAAVPIKSCDASAKFDPAAKKIKQDTANAMITGLLGSAVNLNVGTKDEKEPPAIWCRDAFEIFPSGVYRANNATDGYMLAISDAGAAIYVGPDLAATLLEQKSDADAKKETNKTEPKSYSITLNLPDSVLAFQPRDGLPSPSQALQIVEREAPNTTTRNWGKQKGNIEINSGAMK